MAEFPDLPSNELAPFHTTWGRTRTVLLGSDAVKAKGRIYLPSVSGQSEDDYQSYKLGVSFTPLARSVKESYLGLMMRKPPVLEDGDVLKNVKNVLTRNGLSVDRLSKWVAGEVITTNWCGLLVDQDAVKPGTSLADLQSQGIRPFIAPYTAENILEVEFGVVRGERKPVRVRLKDSDTQVRILSLDDSGDYTVEKITKVDQTWTSQGTTKPTIARKPLKEIPFVVVSLEPTDLPERAPIEDVVQLNCDHYAASGAYHIALLHASTPTRVITGFKPPMEEVEVEERGPDGIVVVKKMVPKQVTFDTSPNAIWVFGDKDTKAEVLQFDGQSIKDLRQRVADMEDKVAELSGGFWTREKASVEAPETHRLRLSTQNAKVALMANTMSDRILEALRWMARWMGADGEAIRFSFNTDYLPLPMTAADLKAQVEANEKGQMSDESLFYSMRDRQVYDQALTWEVEKARREADEVRKTAKALADQALGINQPSERGGFGSGTSESDPASE